MIRKTLWSWIVAAAVTAHPVAAQEALVLSGGGARGLAHVGAVAGIEELGYDPDIVVGTSMGALVGALYAAGYTPEEIEERVLAIIWNELFTATPLVVGPDRAVRYPMMSVDLDVQRMRAARGFVGQWRINRALATLLFDANARARGDFDRLPRRYRAVAADLLTGEPVILAEGDLARAARASMAVPGFFAPVAWGDQVLVDGGITNNLPTDVARGLGAQRVIAVDVSRPSDLIESLAPLVVLGRAIDLMQENTARDTAAPDALVLPVIAAGVSGATFPADALPLFEIGAEAARRDLDPSPPRIGSGERPQPTPPDTLYELLIEAPDSSLAAMARRVFAHTVPGAYDAAEILEAMDELYSTGLFEAVWPRVVENPDTARNAPVLLVRLDAPPGLALAGAAGFESDRGGRAWATLTRYSRVGRLPAILDATASLEGLERWASLGVRVYPRLRPAIALSGGAFLRQNDVRHFEGDALRKTNVHRVGGWAGVEVPHVLADRVTGAAIRAEWIDEECGGDGFSVGPYFRFGSLNPDVLVVGEPLLVEAEMRWGEISYSRIVARGSRVFELNRLLLAGIVDVRRTTSGAPLDVVPAMGDEPGVPGMRWGEDRVLSRAVVGADLAIPIRSIHLRLRGRAAAGGPELRFWAADEWVTGIEVGTVWQTPLFGLEAGFGISAEGDGRFDVSVGRTF